MGILKFLKSGFFGGEGSVQLVRELVKFCEFCEMCFGGFVMRDSVLAMGIPGRVVSRAYSTTLEDIPD